MKQEKINYRKIPRTGHNLSTYFRFFQEYYDDLPEYMLLTKGHMIGRHCSREFFERTYKNHYFTFLYEDAANTRKMTDINIAFMAAENWYCEKNNDWYVIPPSHPHRYFVRYNDLLQFIYQDPVLPEYTLFAPGGCYIVNRDQVKKHTKTFYKNMNKIMSYGLNPSFPSEAFHVERMMPVIFCADYKENPWMNDDAQFDLRLKEAEGYVQKWDEQHKNDSRLDRRIIRKIKHIMNSPFK